MAEKREMTAKMTAMEYLKEKSRMTQECQIGCDNCMLFRYNNEMTVFCDILENKHPEKAVAIVQKWSEEHPKKTFLSDFLEKYPNAPMEDKGFPKNVCPFELGYVKEKCQSPTPFNDYCKECWSRPLED